MENRRFFGKQELKDNKSTCCFPRFFPSPNKKAREPEAGKRIYFQEMQMGEEYSAILLLGSILQKTDRKGNPYVELSLSDGEENAFARKFDCTAESLANKGISKNSLVEIQLHVTNYNGGKNYTAVSLQPSANAKYSLMDFIPKAPIYPEYTFDNLLTIIRNSPTTSLQDRNYKSLAFLTEKILVENKVAFCTSTAAKNIHHNMVGGLLYHTYNMVKNAQKQLEIYPTLDKELLICGAALHDIGKIREMSTPLTGNGEYTDVGRLLGHSVLGILMIEEETRMNCYNGERVKLLEHMIASHHGHTECGAIVAPAIPEANILHALDMMDGKINMYHKAYKDMVGGTISGKIYGLENNNVYRAAEIS